MRNADERDILSIHEHDISIRSREIFLQGEIDPDGYATYNIIKNLSILEKQSKKPIIIHQYSGGGDIAGGLAIYDAIAMCKCPIIFICYGMAASMGSIIPQACVAHGNSYRVCTPNCIWLVHEGYVSSDGTYKYLQSLSSISNILNRKLLDIYISSCANGPYFDGKSRAQVRTFLKNKIDKKEDWWFEANEAVEYGFVDGILGTENFWSISDMIAEFGV